MFVERVVQLGGLAGVAVVLLACSPAPRAEQVEARSEVGVLQVEALVDVHITHEPLGDVVLGELRAGDRAAAECLVERAQGNGGGDTGSAVRVSRGRTTGYAAVTTLPADRAARRMIFDVDEQALRRALPACAPVP